MVRKAAHQKFVSGFNYIVKGDAASRVLAVFGRMKNKYREFDPILYSEEYVFTGNNMYNNLIVIFSEHFSLSNFSWYEERMKKIEAMYPRLKYVIVVDNRLVQNEYFNKFNVVYLREHESPESVVRALEEFTVEPEKCVMPSQGEGI